MHLLFSHGGKALWHLLYGLEDVEKLWLAEKGRKVEGEKVRR